MTTWELYCAIHLSAPGALTVLGPKCHSVDCLEPAIAVVHWPAGPMQCCARCTDGWRQIADRGFGMHLVIEPMRYTPGPGGLDDSAQRFRLLELE